MNNWARKSLAISAIAAGAVLFAGGTAQASYSSDDQTATNICGNVDAEYSIVINLVDCDADNDDWGGYDWAGAYDQAYADRFQAATDRTFQDRSLADTTNRSFADRNVSDGTDRFQDGTDRTFQDRSADRNLGGSDRFHQDRSADRIYG